MDGIWIGDKNSESAKEYLLPSKSPDRHQLSVAILAIATAAIGFGLFGGDIQFGELMQTPSLARDIQWARLAGIAFATVSYFLVLVTVGRMLPKDQISGKELTNGPFAWFYMEMVSLAWLYMLSVIEQLGT